MQSFKHLSDGVLIRTLEEKVASENNCTAEVVALIAEVEGRQLYRGMGYQSMFLYCVHGLHLSEDAAYKRIQAARAARTCPAILQGLADGRLSLTVVVRLKPHLTRENWRELLRASVHKTKTEVEQMLASRFPRPDVPTSIRPVEPAMETAVAGPVPQLVPEPVGSIATAIDAASVMGTHGNPEPAGLSAPTVPATPGRVDPLLAESYKVQFTMRKDTHALMREVQELEGRKYASEDLDQFFHRTLEARAAELRKKKFAATDKPRVGKPLTNPGRIPARVRREVWKRDGGRCTFKGDGGHRCEARSDLEFDHIEPVARGGGSTVTNL